MSDSTYDDLKPLHAAWRRAETPDERTRALEALLDAHVIDPRGVGTYTLDDGAAVYDTEDLLGVGAMLASGEDPELSAVPIAWLEAAPGTARLYVLASLLSTQWATQLPPTEHVERVRAVFEAVDPVDVPTRLGVQAALALRGGESIDASRDVPPEPVPERDPRFIDLLEGLAAIDPRERDLAASAIDDLLQGPIHPEDFANVVAGLLRQAKQETDPSALESILYAAGTASGHADSGTAANWDPVLELLGTIEDPHCLGYLLEALGTTYLERYRKAITPFLEHSNGVVREAAELAIAELDHAYSP